MASKKKTAAVQTKKGRDPNRLDVPRGPVEDIEDAVARSALRPTVRGALTIKEFSRVKFAELDLMGLIKELSDQSKAVNDGDMARAEAMLIVQAHTLDAIFGELARRSVLNMGEYLDAAERYMRLALKAQGQCRATLETLATIKNPPIIYAKQANVTTGPQQINNGTAVPSRAREIETEQTQQSGETHELLPDARASGDASRVNPTLETLGEIDRAKVPRR